MIYPRAENHSILKQAVRRHKVMSREGLLEKLFERLFRGLVYAQIWEDPEIDMEAMALTPECHVVAIASGGCNILSYLTADPARITAVDLSQAHVALNRLKLMAALRLPSWEAFYRFFGAADSSANPRAYDMLIAPHLDEASRAYWDGRSLHQGGRRRISIFARNVYRYGVLGRFIGAGHVAARADRVEVMNRSITDYLAACPAGSRDRYVLLDAQDWMTDAQLNALWTEITRTARPGARVIFRTAAEPSLLPGRVAPELLDQWHYEADASLAFTARDRSAIYGGFHLYVLKP